MLTTQSTAKKRFIENLGTSGNVSAAARAAGIDRTTAYLWRNADEDFAALWDQQCEQGLDELEREAARRALDSSDTLLIFLLKSKRRETFGDRSKLEMSGVFTLANLRDVLGGAE